MVDEGRALIVTADDGLLDEVLRIAAAAGVEMAHSREPAARTLWRTAPVILLDAGQVRAAVEARLTRRPGVVVVFAAAPSEALWELCVRLGVDRTLHVHHDEVELIELLADTVRDGPADGRCVAVVGACGGAGASVFAGAVAFAGARSGAPALLLDCDPWGAGLDVILGVENSSGLRWPDLSARAGRLPAGDLVRALPRIRIGSTGICVLTHDRDAIRELDPDVVDVVIDAGRRSGATTVVDLPRPPGPAPDRVVERCDLVVVIVPADVRGCWSADRICRRLSGFDVPVGLVVRGPSPGGIGADDVAAALELPLLAQMRAESGLANELEFGLSLATGGRRPLLKAARQVLAELERPA